MSEGFGGLPLLKILPDNASVDPQRFTVTYRAGEKFLSAVARIPRLITPEEEESIRWYLEEYRKFPFEPATTIARYTAARLERLGEQLFDHIFNATAEGRDLWTLAEEQLGTTRIEIAGNPSQFFAPWEILWNPLDVMPVACRAGSFVRAGFVPAASAAPNAASVIRVLLVISRPVGILDAPFRSVAARLLDRVDGDPRFHIEVLRPPTFEAFVSAIRAAADEGRPYTVVHFDGHGVHEDVDALRENRPARRRRGYLIFESLSDPERPDYIGARALGEALAPGGAPILILNACRSARTEIWTEEMGDRRPFGSLADELLRLGQPSVLAMQYNVEVETASRFVADLYQGLADRGPLAEGVQIGRRNLFIQSARAIPDRSPKLHDWLVPVLFEISPRSLLLKHSSSPRETQHSSKPVNTTVGVDDGLMAVERAFQKAPVVVLTGPVGSGKTTLATEFAAWDARTRDEADRARSPLILLDAAEKDSVKGLTSGSRVLIETRDAMFPLALEHAVVDVTPLDLQDRIALMRQGLPTGVSFDPEEWQSVLAFSQGNPVVLLDIAALIGNAPAANPGVILETARSEPVGLKPNAFAPALSMLDSADMDCLAIAALFEGPVSSRMLRLLASAGSESSPIEDAEAVFDRLSQLGLATPLGSSYYRMHPGLPGLLRPEFERRYPGARGESRRAAMVTLFASICAIFYRHADSGERNAYEVQNETLNLIEPTIRRVLDQAIDAGDWPASRNLAAALRRVLTQHGRRPEWEHLAARLRSLVPDDAHGDPPTGRESIWYFLHQDRIEHLMRIHSLSEATWLQERSLQQVRNEHAHMEKTAATEFAKEVLIPELRRMGDIRQEQRDPDASRYYLEALQIAQRLGSTMHEQRIAAQLAALCLCQEPVDDNKLSYWFTYASELCPPYDRIGQAQLKILHGETALARAQPAEAVEDLQVALTDLLPADLSDERAQCELKLGQVLFEHRKSLPESMQHVQSAIAWYDKDQNVFRASCARLVAGRILAKSEENARAAFYAEEADTGLQV
jgi:hypothetical protein